ncbi:LuxR C-terminal-related transcriptional regulator [uncultured Vibrio sp.]|uniref:LuxR C-terminal-related transcriptional regulator n=1 Tax=uncultured Vibrio sp. TaxID=114054 RepID=UPI00345C3FA8
MLAYKNKQDIDVDPLSVFTSRQRPVLQLLAESYSTKEITNILNVSSSRTVEFHKYKMV